MTTLILKYVLRINKMCLLKVEIRDNRNFCITLVIYVCQLKIMYRVEQHIRMTFEPYIDYIHFVWTFKFVLTNLFFLAPGTKGRKIWSCV